MREKLTKLDIIVFLHVVIQLKYSVSPHVDLEGNTFQEEFWLSWNYKLGTYNGSNCVV